MSRKSSANESSVSEAAAAAEAAITEPVVTVENAQEVASETAPAVVPAAPVATATASTTAKKAAEPKLPRIAIPNDVDSIAAAVEEMLASCALRSREPRLSVAEDKSSVSLLDGTCKRIVSGENAPSNVAAALARYAGDKRWLSSPTKNGWQTCRFILRRDGGVEIPVAGRLSWKRESTPAVPSAPAAAEAAAAEALTIAADATAEPITVTLPVEATVEA